MNTNDCLPVEPNQNLTDEPDLTDLAPESNLRKYPRTVTVDGYEIHLSVYRFLGQGGTCINAIATTPKHYYATYEPTEEEAIRRILAKIKRNENVA